MLCTGVISSTCHIDDDWTYKGAILLEPEEVLQKAQYICDKTFHLEPILKTYKKKLIEDPITDKILEMIERGDVDKLDFSCEKITNDYSLMIITDEAKYQSYIKVETKTKILYSKQLHKYGDMIGFKCY